MRSSPSSTAHDFHHDHTWVHHAHARMCTRVRVARLWHIVDGMRIMDLLPGTKLENAVVETAVYFGRIAPHPIKRYGDKGFWCIIWWMPDAQRWSFDCLSPTMALDLMGFRAVESDTEAQRQANLQKALFNKGSA